MKQLKRQKKCAIIRNYTTNNSDVKMHPHTKLQQNS